MKAINNNSWFSIKAVKYNLFAAYSFKPGFLKLKKQIYKTRVDL